MKRLYHLWNEYWFKPAQLMNLAVLRILCVALALLTTLSLREKVHHAFELITLPESLYHPPFVLKFLTLPFNQVEKPSATAVLLLTWIMIISGILGLVGLKTNLSLLAFSVGYLFINALNYSFGEFHHPEGIMMLSLSVLSISPCGKVLSLDHLLDLRRTASLEGTSQSQYSFDSTSEYANWPIKTIQWMFALIYLSAAVAKLFKGGFDWVNGYTLQFYLLDSGVRPTTPIGLWLGQQHSLAVLFSVITLLFEATFWLVLIFPKLTWFYIPVGIGMHVGIYLAMRPDFYEFIILYAAFISWVAVFRFLIERSRTLNRITGYDVGKTPPMIHL